MSALAREERGERLPRRIVDRSPADRGRRVPTLQGGRGGLPKADEKVRHDGEMARERAKDTIYVGRLEKSKVDIIYVGRHEKSGTDTIYVG